MSLASMISPKDTNPKTALGAAKPALGLVPGPALVHISGAFEDGARKYGPANWRVDPVSCSTYINAALRHLYSWQDGEEVAEDSGVHHLAHAAACLMIILDAQTQGSMVDDRPAKGTTTQMIKEKTKKI